MMLSANNNFRKGWDDMMRERDCQPWTFYKSNVNMERFMWKEKRLLGRRALGEMMCCHIFTGL